ncbi:MAG: hypothetical protein AMXMBFR84_04110 [Candidatus Hydrogenedentota bacterium]
MIARIAEYPTLLRAMVYTVLLIVLVIVVQRFYIVGADFGEPFLLHPDEDVTTGLALDLVKEGKLNPGWLGYPTLHTYLTASSHVVSHFRFLTGGEYKQDYFDPNSPHVGRKWPNINAYEEFMFYREARKLNGLFVAGMAICVFMIGKMLFNSAVGAVSAFWALIFPNLVEEGHYAVPQALLVFVSVLSIYFAVRYVKDGRLLDLYLAALCSGLALGTKYNFIPLGIVLVSLMLVKPLARWPHAPLVVMTSLASFLLSSPYTLLDLPKFMENFGDGIYAYKWGAGHTGASSVPPLVWYGRVWLSYGVGYIVLATVGLLALPFLRGKQGLVVLTFVLFLALLSANIQVLFERNVLQAVPFFALGFGAFCCMAYEAVYIIAGKFVKWKPLLLGLSSLTPIVITCMAMSAPIAKSEAMVRRFTTRTTLQSAQIWFNSNAPKGAKVICDSTWLPATVPIEGDKFEVTKGPEFLFVSPYVDYLDYDYAVSAFGGTYDALPPIKNYVINKLMGPTSRLTSQPILDELTRNREIMMKRLPLLERVNHLPPTQDNRTSVFNFDVEVYEIPKFEKHVLEAETFSPDSAIAAAMAATNYTPKDAFSMSWEGTIQKQFVLTRGAYDVFIIASCDVGNESPSQTAEVRVGDILLPVELYCYERKSYFVGTAPVAKEGPTNVSVTRVDGRFIAVDRIVLVKTDLDPDALSAIQETANQFASPNLLTNGTFELGDPQASWVYNGKSGAVLSRDESVKHEGKTSLRVELPATTNFAAVQYVYSVSPGKKFRLQGFIRTENLTDFACLEVQDSDRGHTAFSVQSTPVTGTSDWIASTVDFTVPPDTENLAIMLRRPFINPNQSGTGRIWFDEIALNELK